MAKVVKASDLIVGDTILASITGNKGRFEGIVLAVVGRNPVVTIEACFKMHNGWIDQMIEVNSTTPVILLKRE